MIQQGVGFADLGLVVVDEQHRFGVHQRDELRSRPGTTTPHVLVMTATPIPRTVALTLYGDLDTSVLDELPAGRQPIATTAVPAGVKPRWLERAWERVHEEVAAGHQVYVVCPRIGEEGGEPGTEDDEPARAADDLLDPEADADEEPGPEARPPLAVAEVAPMLAAGPLAGLRLEVLHGRMPTDEKDAVMRAFSEGRVDVLVATTVIEVGVDVPNATMMIIMDADRFGVSQLHQLRGRVGRGSASSSCLFVTEALEGSPALTRLERLAATPDGFEVVAARPRGARRGRRARRAAVGAPLGAAHALGAQARRPRRGGPRRGPRGGRRRPHARPSPGSRRARALGGRRGLGGVPRPAVTPVRTSPDRPHSGDRG